MKTFKCIMFISFLVIMYCVSLRESYGQEGSTSKYDIVLLRLASIEQCVILYKHIDWILKEAAPNPKLAQIEKAEKAIDLVASFVKEEQDLLSDVEVYKRRLDQFKADVQKVTAPILLKIDR